MNALLQTEAYAVLDRGGEVFAVWVGLDRRGLFDDFDDALDLANTLDLDADPTGMTTVAEIREWATGKRVGA